MSLSLSNPAGQPATTSTATASRQTLDQRRAKHAWEKVAAIKDVATNGGDQRPWQDYTGEAHKLPVRIISSGLGQALAFLHAKQKKKPGLVALLRDLSDWVLEKRIEDSVIPKQTSADLLQAVINSDTEFLRWATNETLAYLQWTNRFAEGLGFEPATESDP